MDDAAIAGDAVLGDLPRDEAFIRDVREEIEAAIAEAEAAGPPAMSTLFEDVYAQKELSS
jgi:TPP-dependent pyruvate/acetoin dehydrogenase alpha subunit